MSCSWGYRCTVCEVDSPTYLNHGDDTLRKVYASREMIRQVEEIDWPIEVSFNWCDGSETFDFLEKHEGDGHNICLVDEYGRTSSIQAKESS